MLAPLELRCHQSGLAIFAEGRPVVREVLAFEALAADLLGVQSVDDRVVDLLEKLAVDALVDRPRDAIGIDQQHGDTRVGGHRQLAEGGVCLRTSLASASAHDAGGILRQQEAVTDRLFGRAPDPRHVAVVRAVALLERQPRIAGCASRSALVLANGNQPPWKPQPCPSKNPARTCSSRDTCRAAPGAAPTGRRPFRCRPR